MRVDRWTALLLVVLLLALPLPALAEEAPAPSAPLAAGYLHSAIVKADGSLWATGSNTYGQLGTGNAPLGVSSEGSGDDYVSQVTEFTRVAGDMRAVYAGYLDTFAIAQDGTLYAWGWNEGGQLGTGDNESRDTPTPVLDHVSLVSPGTYHTAAVDENGTLWTWGWNHYGQLGAGTQDDLNAPKETLAGVRSVSVGTQHTMAVKTDNTLWGTGDNSYGQLSNSAPTQLTGFQQIMTDVQDVACNGFGTLILKTDGTLLACGYNAQGQLGIGNFESTAEPVTVMRGVASIAAGIDFSAAIDRGGVLYAWGRDDHYQYGETESPSPIRVAEGVDHVALGGAHLLYLTADGTVYGLGNNLEGELGTGDTEAENQARQIAEGVSTTPKATSRTVLTVVVALLILAVLALFAWLIRRTLQGKKKEPEKKPLVALVRPVRPAGQDGEGKPLSDKELIRLTDEMARQQSAQNAGADEDKD